MKYNDGTTQKLVIEKTTEFLRKNGVRGWNMDELSRSTGLAKNTLYRIIGSKENLLEQATLNHCKKIYGQLLRVLEDGGDYFDVLTKLLATYGEISPTYFNEIFLEYPRIEISAKNHNVEVKNRLINYIDDGIRAGLLKNLGAEKIFDLLRSIGMFYAENTPDERERAEKIQFAFRCVLEGIISR